MKEICSRLDFLLYLFLISVYICSTLVKYHYLGNDRLWKNWYTDILLNLFDQAVARAESFKPPPAERRMTRSISCVSNMKITRIGDQDRLRPSLFQSRGVHLKRDRSLTCDNVVRHRQVSQQVAKIFHVFANIFSFLQTYFTHVFIKSLRFCW